MRRILRSPLLAALLALCVNAASADTGPGLDTLRESAKNGDVDAMLELGILYEYGYRMTDNKPPALAWYRIAAENGNPKAGARQDALKNSMSAKEVEDADKLYNEYVASVRKPAPTVAAPAPAPAEPTPAVAPTPETTPQNVPRNPEVPTAAAPTKSPVLKKDQRQTVISKDLDLNSTDSKLKEPEAQRELAAPTK